MLFTKPTMVDPRVALRGRDTAILSQPFFHRVFGHPIDRVPEGAEVAVLGLGCFWGAEKLYWNTPGVLNTAVGYAGGYTPNPTYEEACSGRTGHAEVVRVVYDPAKLSYEDVLRIFFENHNPTQGFRQGNDRGTQYRSGIYTLNDDQARRAEAVRDALPPSSPPPASVRSPPRSPPLASSTTPRATTSSTWTRTRSVTAPCMRPG